MLIGVGASTWASGNQVWNGKTGTLMAKPMNSSRNIVYWKPGCEERLVVEPFCGRRPAWPRTAGLVVARPSCAAASRAVRAVLRSSHRSAPFSMQHGRLAGSCSSDQVEGVTPADVLLRRRRCCSALSFADRWPRASLDRLVVDEVAHVGEVEAQQRDQDEHAAEQRVQEELDGRVLAARPAPDADEEVHRQQHHFPEDVEQEEVQRQERADHAGFQQQEQHAVAADVLVDLPAGDHRQEAEDRGQQDRAAC